MLSKPERNRFQAKIKRYGRAATPQAQRRRYGYVGPDPTRSRHETGTAYNRGCRCVICMQTHRDRLNRSRWVRIALREKFKKAIPAPHGLASTYTNWGCRCVICRKVHSKACNLQYHKRKDKST